MNAYAGPAQSWQRSTYGKVTKGDIVDEGLVTGIGHSDNPSGSVVLSVQGHRPLRGANTEPIDVYR